MFSCGVPVLCDCQWACAIGLLWKIASVLWVFVVRQCRVASFVSFACHGQCVASGRLRSRVDICVCSLVFMSVNVFHFL